MTDASIFSAAEKMIKENNDDDDFLSDELDQDLLEELMEDLSLEEESIEDC